MRANVDYLRISDGWSELAGLITTDQRIARATPIAEAIS
jgi:hypothetical protein